MEIDYDALKMDNELLEDRNKYFKAIGYLNYLSLFSSPDAMCVSSILSAYTQKPTKLALKSVTKVFPYFLGTSNKRLKIDLHIDAFFKTTKEKDLNSRSGYIVFCNGNPFTWYSKRQSLTSLSTEEAEVSAANAGIRALPWLRSLVPKVYEDNANAVLWITDLDIKMYMINFEIKLALARECYENGILIIHS
jgi:hypothetical protein